VRVDVVVELWFMVSLVVVAASWMEEKSPLRRAFSSSFLDFFE